MFGELMEILLCFNLGVLIEGRIVVYVKLTIIGVSSSDDIWTIASIFSAAVVSLMLDAAGCCNFYKEQ